MLLMPAISVSRAPVSAVPILCNSTAMLIRLPYFLPGSIKLTIHYSLEGAPLLGGH